MNIAVIPKGDGWGRRSPPRPSTCADGGAAVGACGESRGCRGARSTTWRPASDASRRTRRDAPAVRRHLPRRARRSARARRTGTRSDILLGSRFQLDLYVNLRPIKLLDARLCPLKEARGGRRHGRVPREHRGALRGHRRPVQARHRRRGRDQQDINTRKGVERIIRAAFEYARAARHASASCMADKANAMRHAPRALAARVQEVARGVPEHRGAPPLRRRAGDGDGAATPSSSR